MDPHCSREQAKGSSKRQRASPVTPGSGRKQPVSAAAECATESADAGAVCTDDDGGFLEPDPAVSFGGVLELIAAKPKQASNMSR